MRVSSGPFLVRICLPKIGARVFTLVKHLVDLLYYPESKLFWIHLQGIGSCFTRVVSGNTTWFEGPPNSIEGQSRWETNLS